MSSTLKFALGLVFISLGVVSALVTAAFKPEPPWVIVAAALPLVLVGAGFQISGLRAHWLEYKRIDAQYKRTLAEFEKSIGETAPEEQ